MKILDTDRLDMSKIESKSYLATLKQFGYEELFRTKVYVPEFVKSWDNELKNPDSILMVLVDWTA